MRVLERRLASGRAKDATTAESPWTRTQPGREPLRVLDVDEDPVPSVSHEIRSLPRPRRHERHPGRHRLEHALRPALLTRRDDVRVERVVRRRQTVARGKQPMDEGNAADARARAGRSRVPGP